MPYIFSPRFTVTQRYEAEALLHEAVVSDWSRDRFQREAMKVNLSYNRANMQYDLRRAMSMEKAKTGEGKERAVKFFEEIFEPLRAAKGWTSSQTTAFYAKGKMGTLETLEEQVEFEEVWEEYEAMRSAMGLA